LNALPEERQMNALAGIIVNEMGRMEQFADSDLPLMCLGLLRIQMSLLEPK